MSETHKLKMARKAVRRGEEHLQMNRPDLVRALLGVPAGINRHTMKPHEHKREIARRSAA